MDRIIKPIFWTTRASKDLIETLKFNTQLYGVQKAKEIAHNLRKLTNVLENPKYDFTEIGSVDEDFTHLKHTYRKLIDRNYKITYREGRTKIYIVRVFDTHQNPNKNK